MLGLLGQGGMGVVYEAFDREWHQIVAIKRLLRYEPAALYLYELVVDGQDDVFFTMELVRGSEFSHYVRAATGPRAVGGPDAATQPSSRERNTVRPGDPGPGGRERRALAASPVDADRLRPALRQLVEGIGALHAAGKLHRDIKPSNVLVTREGRVVLLDFGVATELRGRPGEGGLGDGEVVGTARYMAPEQADDETPTPACDWYSVGVMLYEALVGRPPFVGSVVDVLTMKSILDVPPPSECVQGVPPDLDALCVALPPDTWLLARLFPVLQRVPAIAALNPLDNEDPQSVRRRAFTELRELLGWLAKQRPVVLFVDDAQWGGARTWTGARDSPGGSRGPARATPDRSVRQSTAQTVGQAWARPKARSKGLLRRSKGEVGPARPV